MKVPKQIIYPLNYARLPLVPRAAEGERRRFGQALKGLLRTEVRQMPLGRARMGIYLLVKWALRERRRKVILSPYTIPDVVNMVVLAGGEPVFVDLLPQSTSIDLDVLAPLLDTGVACVLITHYHVHQANFAAVRQLCQEREVALFEDCAIALGGTLAGGHVGTKSDGAILSLSGYKFLNYFWGGVVFSRHEALMQWVEGETASWRDLSLRDYGPQWLRTLKYDLAMRWPVFDALVFPLIQRRQRSSAEAVSLIPPRLETQAIDQSLTSKPARAAFAEWNAKFDRLAGYLAHRRAIAAIYDRYLGDLMVSREVDATTRASSCFVNYPVYVGEQRRNGLYKAMIQRGFDVGASLYPNCGDHDKFRDVPGATLRAHDLVRSVISLPTHPRVTPDYAAAIADRLAGLI